MRKITHILTATVLSLGAVMVPAATIAPTAQAQPECTSVHMVNADGTGSSHAANNPSENGLFSPTLESIKYAIETTRDQFPETTMSYWNVPYESAAGALFSAGNANQSPVPYGVSRVRGAQKGLDHIREYHRACPSSLIGVIGYSQGASVAGDIAALLANGAVEGFGNDNFFGAVLLADPGRSGRSQYTAAPTPNKAYIPIPQGAVYERNGEYSTVTKQNTVGWTGQRSLGFKDFSGKVISICHDDDVACSVDPSGPLRTIADLSDKNYAPGAHYLHSKSLSSIFLNNPLGAIQSLGGLQVVTGALSSDNIGAHIPTLKKNALSSALPTEDKDVLVNALNEIEQILKVAHQNNAYGSGVSDRMILAHVISLGYPTVEGKVPQQVKFIVDPLIKAIGSDTGMPEDIKKKMDPIIGQLVSDYHSSYFTGAEQPYMVEDKIAIDWVSHALADGLRNVAQNTPLSVPSDSRNSGVREVSDPDRADDGLGKILDGTIGSARTQMTSDENGAVDNGEGKPDSDENSAPIGDLTDESLSGDGTKISSVDNGVSSGTRNVSSGNVGARTINSSIYSTTITKQSTGQQNKQLAAAKSPSGPEVDTGGSLRVNMWQIIASML